MDLLKLVDIFRGKQMFDLLRGDNTIATKTFINIPIALENLAFEIR
jgi:hypothetical protein